MTKFAICVKIKYEFTYDAKTGLYKSESISTLNEEGVENFEVKFEDGLLVSISYEREGSKYTETFNYDEVTLTLPEITA